MRWPLPLPSAYSLACSLLRVLSALGFTMILSSTPLPLPPRPAEVKHFGCHATQTTDPERKTHWWQLHVWAEYEVSDKWIVLYSMREGTGNIDKSLKDCAHWMKTVEKEVNHAKRNARKDDSRPRGADDARLRGVVHFQPAGPRRPRGAASDLPQ